MGNVFKETVVLAKHSEVGKLGVPAGLITRRSMVQIHPSLLFVYWLFCWQDLGADVEGNRFIIERD